jgi:hypothetical protein
MADVIEQEVKEQVENTETATVTPSNPFDETTWSEKAPSDILEKASTEDKKEVAAATTNEVTTSTSAAEEIIEPSEWLKREFGWENPDVAKKELEELRALKNKESVPNEIAFANDDSKRLFESLKEGKEDDVYELLSLKRQFAKAEKLDVTDAKQASELIRLNLSLKHKDLEPYEISDLFNENYEKPEKPEQSLEQTDDEYKITLDKWQARCDAIDRKIVRDAKMAKPELLQMKKELVYPEIPKKEEVKETPQLTQEQVEAAKKFKESFLQSTTASINELKGFSAQVKDKDVDYSVSYIPSSEEKMVVESALKSFAENGFNANALLAERWVSADGSIRANVMAEDLALLSNKEKVFQKIATDAANQRLELYLKGKKNINVNETKTQGTFTPQDEKSEQQKVADWIWGV